MHTGQQIFPEGFDIEIDGVAATLDGLLPERHAFDRFGIVVTEPLGSLGASLLIQAAIASWFDIRSERRDSRPVYPEIYAFHVGGPHGDHSSYDFWPPRKEVFVAAHDPVALLTEINARAITRLAVPDGLPGDPERLTWGPSTWAEQSAARERLRSCFAYDISGAVAAADVRITATDPRLEENPRDALDLLTAAESLLAEADHAFEGSLPGLSVAADNYRWIDAVRERRHELPTAVLGELSAERAAAREQAGTIRTERFRRLDADAALRLIAAAD
jgi:hypothetical protein